MTPSNNELAQFMGAIRTNESTNNYQQIGENRGSPWGIAEGGYQIMSDIWPSWAADAGFGGLTRQEYLSNKNNVQDRIAAHRMSYYYDAYAGDWSLVAVAWFAGEGHANDAQRAGIDSLAGVNDSGNKKNSGINVPKYVDRILKTMGNTVYTGNSADNAMVNTAKRVGAQGEPAPAVAPTRPPARMLAQEAINQMSENLLNGTSDEGSALAAMQGMFASRSSMESTRTQAPSQYAQPPTQQNTGNQNGVI
jgi:hypothetical protein